MIWAFYGFLLFALGVMVRGRCLHCRGTLECEYEHRFTAWPEWGRDPVWRVVKRRGVCVVCRGRGRASVFGWLRRRTVYTEDKDAAYRRSGTREVVCEKT